MHAPALLPYEAANALLRAVVAGSLEPAVVTEIWATISAVPVTLHPLEAGAEVIAIAAAHHVRVRPGCHARPRLIELPREHDSDSRVTATLGRRPSRHVRER